MRQRKSYYRDQLEALTQLLDQLKEENEEMPLVVEGEKDIKTLRSLGFSGDILKINTGKSLSRFSDMIAQYESKAVILLLDWDAAGNTLCGRIVTALAANGIKTNLQYRALLKKYCKKEIKDVESLDTFIANLSARVNQRSEARS